MNKGPLRWRTIYLVLVCLVVAAIFVYNYNYRQQLPLIALLNTLVDGSTPPYSNVSTEVTVTQVKVDRAVDNSSVLVPSVSTHTPTKTLIGDASFPSPTTTSEDVVIFVLGRRDAFEIRQVIRETWGKDHDNVYFVVGRACPLPPSSRQQYTCVPNTSTTNVSMFGVWEFQVREVDRRILEEQRKYGDLLRVDDVDVYRHLPHKLKSAYAWAVSHTRAKWFAKADDDSVVRVDTLTHYLTTTFDATVPAVIGSIEKHNKPMKTGKWADPSFSKLRYPNFPLGSAGHVVSRPVAEYIASNKDTLFNYQGEDVSIGIWLDESPLKDKVVWNTTPHFANDGNCKDTHLFIIGHNIDTNKMKACYNVMDEVESTNVMTTPQQVDDTWNITYVNPRALDLKNRFDIIVKTVYAVFLRRGNVPIFVKKMYNRHLKVWNNFYEPCTFAQNKDWFDATYPCAKKSTAEDFLQSFSRTLDSIANDGFDTNKSLVPVTSAGFPLNGAHRIASAIALGLPTMPVQRVTSHSVFGWGHAYFKSLGFEEKYADFAILQWTLHVSNVSTVLFWPEAASNVGKMKQARAMVQQDCGDVLYEKSIAINRNGVASMAFHAYGYQSWVSNKIEQLQTTFSGSDDEMRLITVLFISPESMVHLQTCKEKLRSHFALVNPKSSVHIPDYHAEAVLVAEMVLNPNSVMFLNRHEGGNCHTVATEIATRLKLPSVNPASFVLPQNIMVDSGAVISFFGLRKRTDVDLMFQGEINKSILGIQRSILVEAHSFEHIISFHIGSKGSHGGAEHMPGFTVDDLFTDPEYYGYCHGVKYVSLKQMIRYKQRRGVPNKDEIDVERMQRFITGNGTVTTTALELH